jgi:2'-5' RNA ligase
MSEKIRSFIAVDTAEQVKSELARLLNELKGRTALKVKWVKPEQMHLTLVFLGEVSPEFIEKAKAQLAIVAKGFKPFQCQLENLGAFPSVQKARVIWAGLKRGEGELKELQAAVASAMAKIGYVPEKRAFTPHLTLARIRVPDDARFIQGCSFTSSVWLIDRVIIFKSELKPAGPLYTKITEVLLS